MHLILACMSPLTQLSCMHSLEEYLPVFFTTQCTILPQSERDIKLPRMCKTRYRDLQSQYSVYSWFVNIYMYMYMSLYLYVFSARNTVTVGIFYSLPAFQLVFSQQLVCLCDIKSQYPSR